MQMYSEWDYRAPTLSEAHAQWHSVHGKYATCDLDCGASEALDREMYEPQPKAIRCGHCREVHYGVAEVRECSRLAYAAR